MGFRRSSFVLVLLISCLVVAQADQAAASTHHVRDKTVRYHGVRLRVPASWPVIDLATHPSACPRLDVHAVYLGRPGPDPRCPAHFSGKTGSVQLMQVNPAAPDLRQAAKSV